MLERRISRRDILEIAGIIGVVTCFALASREELKQRQSVQKQNEESPTPEPTQKPTPTPETSPNTI